MIVYLTLKPKQAVKHQRKIFCTIVKAIAFVIFSFNSSLANAVPIVNLGSEAILDSRDSQIFMRRASTGFDLQLSSKTGELRTYQADKVRYLSSKFQIGKKVFLIQWYINHLESNAKSKFRIVVFSPQVRYAPLTLFDKVCGLSKRNDPIFNLLDIAQKVRSERYIGLVDQSTCGGRNLSAYSKIFADTFDKITTEAQSCADKIAQRELEETPEWAQRFFSYYKISISALIAKLGSGKPDLKLVCAPQGLSGSSVGPCKEAETSPSAVKSCLTIDPLEQYITPQDIYDGSKDAIQKLNFLIKHELEAHVGVRLEPQASQSECEHTLFRGLRSMCNGDGHDNLEIALRQKCTFKENTDDRDRPAIGAAAAIASTQNLRPTQSAVTAATTTPAPTTEGTDKGRTLIAAIGQSEQTENGAGTRPVDQGGSPSIDGGSQASRPISTGYAHPVQPPSYPVPSEAVQQRFREQAGAAVAISEGVFGRDRNESSDRSDRASGSQAPSGSGRRDTSVMDMAAQLMAGQNNPSNSNQASNNNALTDRFANRLETTMQGFTKIAQTIVPPATAAALGDHEVLTLEGTVGPDGKFSLQSGIQTGPGLADAASRVHAGLGSTFDQRGADGSLAGVSTIASGSSRQAQKNSDGAKPSASLTNTSPSSATGSRGIATLNQTRAGTLTTNTASTTASNRPVASASVNGAAESAARAESAEGDQTAPDAGAESNQAIGSKPTEIKQGESPSATSAKLTTLTTEQQRQLALLPSISSLTGDRYEKLKSNYDNQSFQAALRERGICIRIRTQGGIEIIGDRANCRRNNSGNNSERAPASDTDRIMQFENSNLQNRRRDGSGGAVILIDNGKMLERLK